MPRTTRSFLRGFVVAGSLWSLAGAALAQDLPATGPVLTVNEARGAFASAGYQVGQTLTWDWTSPPVSSFHVYDLASDRVLMVLVYPNAVAAQTQRQQRLAHEPGLVGGNPHLIPGYGQSVWSGNVALVQTTQSQIERVFQLQLDHDNGVYVNTDLVQDPSTPEFGLTLISA